jgi:hypothetical protein
MAWRVLRPATAEDVRVLEAAAERFARRHGVPVVRGLRPEPALDAVMWATSSDVDLRRRWRRVVRRVLDAPGADGIAYGAVGFEVR